MPDVASRRAIVEAVVNRGVSKEEVREIVEKAPREDRKARKKRPTTSAARRGISPLGIPGCICRVIVVLTAAVESTIWGFSNNADVESQGFFDAEQRATA